jgi:hypothetical protein
MHVHHPNVRPDVCDSSTLDPSLAAAAQLFGDILSDIQVPPAHLPLLARSLSRAGLDRRDDMPLRDMIDMRDGRPRTDLGPSATLCS